MPKIARNRPVKPVVDPIYSTIRSKLMLDGRSYYALSQASGLSASTIRNWENNKVRRPQSLSLQMAAQALGYRIALVKA